MLFLIVLGLMCLGGAAYFLSDAVTAPARERQTSVRRAATYGRFRPAVGRGQLPFRERVLIPLGDRLARWTLKLHPKTTIDGVSGRLLAAGLGRKIAPTTFLALKSAFAIGGLVLGALFGGALTGAGGVLLFAIALGGIGFIAPDFPGSAKARSPQEAVQADQLGISLGRILRVQATDSRLKRQAAAEEKAMKAPIKMLFPTVMFIFPAMFLVILGPAFLNISKIF